jgi:hypothetical protein
MLVAFLLNLIKLGNYNVDLLLNENIQVAVQLKRKAMIKYICGGDKIMEDNLIYEFLEILNEPDPPQVLLLKGIYLAADWIKSLDLTDDRRIYTYMEEQLKRSGDIPIKEQIIKVLQLLDNPDSIRLLEYIIRDGDEIHGKYLVNHAIAAKKKLSEK